MHLQFLSELFFCQKLLQKLHSGIILPNFSYGSMIQNTNAQIKYLIAINKNFFRGTLPISSSSSNKVKQIVSLLCPLRTILPFYTLGKNYFRLQKFTLGFQLSKHYEFTGFGNNLKGFQPYIVPSEREFYFTAPPLFRKNCQLFINCCFRQLILSLHDVSKWNGVHKVLIY